MELLLGLPSTPQTSTLPREILENATWKYYQWTHPKKIITIYI